MIDPPEAKPAPSALIMFVTWARAPTALTASFEIPEHMIVSMIE